MEIISYICSANAIRYRYRIFTVLMTVFIFNTDFAS